MLALPANLGIAANLASTYPRSEAREIAEWRAFAWEET